MKRTVIEEDREDAGAIARVEISWNERGSVRAALRLLTRAVLEVVVRAREEAGVHAPAQVKSREAEGSRWNG